MQRTNGYSNAKRARRDWRAWLLLIAVTCTVALYSIEVTHNHRTAADDLRCPVCHVLGHNALDTVAPDLAPALVPALLLFLQIIPVRPFVPGRREFFTPPSRAPPTR